MSDFTRDKLISSMMQPKSAPNKGGSLIQEIGSPACNKEDVIELNENGEFEVESPNNKKETALVEDSTMTRLAEPEGPSLFEEMMLAQAEAKKEKEKETSKATNKSFGTGFKKGFFNSGGSSSTAKKKSATTSGGGVPVKKGSDIIDVKASTSKSHKAGIASKPLNNLAKEVNAAMEESTSPAVKELQKGEWMTPDLMQTFASNPIIARGLRNPKCQKAMELMQKNPEQAKKQFLGDTEVDEFIKEFGKVMGTHFDKLGDEQERKQASNLGPLAEAALKREQERLKNTKANPGIQPYDAKAAEEEKKVKDIVNNPELANLLMDPKMQTILQECGNPTKFQEHMKNPDTARKIKLLFDSGLVKTE